MGTGRRREAAALWQSGTAHQAAATAALASARQQVQAAGDEAAAIVREASAAAPSGITLTAASLPVMLPVPGGGGNAWDNVIGAHPVPGTIDATSAETHILYGDGPGSGGHIYDSGVPDKTVFPESWDAQDIMNAVNDVANNPDQTPVEEREGVFEVTGTRDGVDIKVIVGTDGTVKSAYPTGGQGVAVNDANGDPQPLPGSGPSAAQAEVQAQAEAAAQAEATAEAEAEAEALAMAEELGLGDE